MNKAIVQGMVGAFIASGVDLVDLDLDNEVLKIVIPKDSYEWRMNGSKVKSPEDYARRIKETWHQLGIFKNGKVEYKVKDVYWTKDMSTEAQNKFIKSMRKIDN